MTKESTSYPECFPVDFFFQKDKNDHLVLQRNVFKGNQCIIQWPLESTWKTVELQSSKLSQLIILNKSVIYKEVQIDFYIQL